MRRRFGRAPRNEKSYETGSARAPVHLSHRVPLKALSPTEYRAMQPTPSKPNGTEQTQSNPSSSPSRRDFIRTTAAVGAAAAATLVVPSGVYAQGPQTLKVGLVGCGSRGMGAAGQALGADPNAKLVALADLFRDE